tara:strand:- start:1000 stop:1296 length:297 start_codon:yes stop_codon:yes gene_type:complete
MDMNTRVIRNNFVWDGDTVTINDDTTAAGFEQVAVQGSYCIISNKGPINISVGSSGAGTATGILVEPGASLEFAVTVDATIYVHAAATTGTYSVVWFK